MNTKPKSGSYISCATCKNDFYIYPYEIDKKKFCSIKCRTNNKEYQQYRIDKLREKLVGKKRSEQVKYKIGAKNKINMLQLWKNSEYRDKQVKSHLFITQTPESIEKRVSKFTGINHPYWKGDNAGYRSVHKWVERRLGKADYCENSSTHISTRYHWANISGEYKRELTDWKKLCPKCNRNDGVKIHKRFLKGGYQHFSTR